MKNKYLKEYIDYKVNTLDHLIKSGIQYDSIYESPLSPNYTQAVQHEYINNARINSTELLETKTTKNSNKLLTFILVIRNRNRRANACLDNLTSICKGLEDLVDIILVEEQLNDNFKPESDFNIKHILIDSTNEPFNRGMLLNIGVHYCNSDFFVAYDCDFVAKDISPLIKKVKELKDFKNIFFRCALYESEASIFSDGYRSELHPYSYVWIYNKTEVIKIGGFNTEIKGWGFEEVDLASRIARNNQKLIQIDQNFLHLTHTDNSRDKTNAKKNEGIFMQNIKIPDNLSSNKMLKNSSEKLIVFKYSRNEIFDNEDSIIYTKDADVYLIGKEKFKCKFISNLVNIDPTKEDPYKKYKTVNFISPDRLGGRPTWPWNKDNKTIGIVTASYNTNESIFSEHLNSISKQSEEYLQVIVDSFSETNIFDEWLRSTVSSVFIKHKSNKTKAIQLGADLIEPNSKYWLWLNSDDELYDDKVFSKFIKYAEQDEEQADCYYGRGIYFDTTTKKSKDVWINKEIELDPRKSFENQVGICQPSVYFRSSTKEIKESLETLKDSLVFDYELWIKLAHKGVGFKFIDENFSKFNLTDTNITNNRREEQLMQTLSMVERYYNRTNSNWRNRISDLKSRNLTGIMD